MRKAPYLLVVLLFTLSFPALAHDGHGTLPGTSLLHYFSEPRHTLFTISVFILTASFFLYRNRTSKNEKA